MPASQVLQQLYSLDTSSPDFSRLLYGLIRQDEEEKYSSNLKGLELARLMDLLDEVRALLLAFHPVTKQTPQALSAIPTTDDVSRQCLYKLQAICGYHMALPSSYTVSGEITRVGDRPIALGGFADVWEGTHGDRKVCVKSFRVSLNDDQTLKKVRIWHRHVIFVSTQEQLAAVVLQRGRYMEKVETPKCRSFHRRYKRTFTNFVGVDAEWNSDELRREKSRRESDRPGGSSPRSHT